MSMPRKLQARIYISKLCTMYLTFVFPVFSLASPSVPPPQALCTCLSPMPGYPSSDMCVTHFLTFCSNIAWGRLALVT